MAEVFDDRPCTLGEGPLWHPQRSQLFWFDIPAGKLLSRGGDETVEWHFAEMVSAAGWVDRSRLLIASEASLFLFDLETESAREVVPLEADNMETRSNDGRADPQGGFWIGTMGKWAQPQAGAIYRYYDGQLRRIFPGLTIPNAICFAPDGGTAYFTDTPTRKLLAQPLGTDGWPEGAPSVLIDFTAEGLNPDGAVTDADGNIWIAQWGAGRVAVHAPDGKFLRAIPMGAKKTSCPAFGGARLDELFVTTAQEGYDADALAGDPLAGQLFTAPAGARGRPEPPVRL